MSEQTPRTTVGAAGWRAGLEAIRVRHWIKNAFVLAPILFSGQFVYPSAWGCSLAAALAFCLLSSAVYVFNDVCDAAADRKHPIKRNRPVASGRLSRGAALVLSGGLLAAGLACAGGLAAALAGAGRALYAAGFLCWAGAYVVLNLLYSLGLKDKSVADVILVALGFVLRAMAGASAIAVPFSPWLVVCTFCLCLYIALTKRRSEILELPLHQQAGARRVNLAYRPADLEHMISVAAAVAVVTYILYCLAPTTVQRFGSPHMIWTIPLVVYGLFRYDRITRQAGQNDPVEVLVRDRVMWAVLALYLALTAVLRIYGHLEWTKRILDF